MTTYFEKLLWIILSKFNYYFEGSYTQQVILAAWNLLSKLWYFVAIGIVLTTLVYVLIPKHRIASFFRTKGNVSILIAALLGIVSPLGTYTLIPLIAGLLVVGVPAPPLVAFLVASPLMNPNLFFITAGALGYELAIVRVIAALILGVVAGLFTQLLISRKFIDQHNLVASYPNGGDPIITNYRLPVTKLKECHFLPHFLKELFRLTKFVGKYFLLSIVLAAIVAVFVPPSFITKLLGKGQFLSILIATSVGIPLYVCGGGAIPVVKVLYNLGMSKGAILAFFIAGPATKLSTLIAMKAAFKKELFIIYLIVTLIGALILGYLYNLW